MSRRLAPSVVLAPYLPLRRPVDIGSWTLVPYAELEELAGSAEARTFARRLTRAYAKAEIDGAVAVRQPARELLGSPTVADFRRLRLALTFATLDANVPDDAAHWCTSENAGLYAHSFGEFTAVLEGALVQTLRGISFGKGAMITAPTELPRPSRVQLDGALASAAYRELRTGGPIRARLRRAIEWLSTGWANTTAVAPDVRVFAFRSGLEALMAVGNSHLSIARALSELLDEPSARRTSRQWPNLKGELGQMHLLTEREWWFVNLSFLRNDISHGVPSSRVKWRWRGEHHLFRAERELRAAVRAMLVAEGHEPALALADEERAQARRHAQMTAIVARRLGA
jgi:hypothetical protein